ncbi:MAG: Vacuole effluxer Atg22 like protein [Syntrophaceae bacterium PtaU1.Bin231]|nr:MAG: Vacuole effluxer Atg22 like protein [Syntrophaceae bacterium PtaU1.Bin231]
MEDDRRAVWSWALYDWANSAFATTVMAGFFPLFFKGYWADPGAPEQSTFWLGLANSAAAVIAAAASPFLGAVADRGSAKKRFLFLFTYLGCIMTGGLWFVARGDWPLAVALYVAANVGFSGGNTFYDSLLPGVASEQRVDYASSLGYALGYAGGGILFLTNVLMYLKPAAFGIADGPTAIRLSFVSVGLWWAAFSIPVFVFVKEPAVENAVPLSRAFAVGWRQLAGTLREIRRLRTAGLFLLAYWLYIDGVDTIIRMAVDFGMSLGFPAGSLISALLMVQFLSFPATLLYLKIAARIGVKQAILTAVAGYCVVAVGGYFMDRQWHFFALAAGVAAEFYGFYNMLGKFSAVIGPVLLGGVTVLTGNIRYGVLSILLLFVSGGWLLYRLDIPAGEKIFPEHRT